MFTGSGPAQPFLDYALINLIADAPNDAKVDISIDKKNITSLDVNIFDFGSFDYNTRIENFVSLKKFFNLESLVIDFDKFNIKTNKDNGVDLEEVFLRGLEVFHYHYQFLFPYFFYSYLMHLLGFPHVYYCFLAF